MDDVKTAGNSHVPSSSFAREVEAEPGGADIAKCIQCGMCTASCMVASVTDKYRPRKLIQMILLGLREEVLSLDTDLSWNKKFVAKLKKKYFKGESTK
jgi:heterodisulfide reductase subunit C